MPWILFSLTLIVVKLVYNLRLRLSLKLLMWPYISCLTNPFVSKPLCPDQTYHFVSMVLIHNTSALASGKSRVSSIFSTSVGN